MKNHIQKLILKQFELIRRDLPWRNEKDPYKIWLSEILLQQTTVRQALPYYNKFVQKFPDIYSLAQAEESEILHLCQGLGYYSRGKNLHACARKLVQEFDGIFPKTVDELRKLPGIGPYTSAAIASIAFNQRTPVLDGNVMRLLARLIGLQEAIATPSFKKKAYEWLYQMMPDNNTGKFNEALMESGALICLPKNPRCGECLLRNHCYAFEKKAQTNFPVKSKKKSKIDWYYYYVVSHCEDGLQLIKRPRTGIWAGMYDFPFVQSSSFLSQEKLNQLFNERLSYSVLQERFIMEESFLLTHRRLKCFYFVNQSEPLGHVECFSFEKMSKLPLTKAVCRFLERQKMKFPLFN